MQTLSISPSIKAVHSKLGRRAFRKPNVSSKLALNAPHGRGDVVSHLVSLAERKAGFKPGHIGWLAWFRRVLLSENVLLRTIMEASMDWPPLEREFFELYYVHHFALAEIEAIAGCTSEAFHAHLRFIQRRLREIVLREVLRESKRLVNNNCSPSPRCCHR